MTATLAEQLGRCEIERDTYKRIAERSHELHQDIMDALPIIEGVYETLIDIDPELADSLHESIERLQGMPKELDRDNAAARQESIVPISSRRIPMKLTDNEKATAIGRVQDLLDWHADKGAPHGNLIETAIREHRHDMKECADTQRKIDELAAPFLLAKEIGIFDPVPAAA